MFIFYPMLVIAQVILLDITSPLPGGEEEIMADIFPLHCIIQVELLEFGMDQLGKKQSPIYGTGQFGNRQFPMYGMDQPGSKEDDIVC